MHKSKMDVSQQTKVHTQKFACRWYCSGNQPGVSISRKKKQIRTGVPKKKSALLMLLNFFLSHRDDEWAPAFSGSSWCSF